MEPLRGCQRSPGISFFEAFFQVARISYEVSSSRSPLRGCLYLFFGVPVGLAAAIKVPRDPGRIRRNSNTSFWSPRCPRLLVYWRAVLLKLSRAVRPWRMCRCSNFWDELSTGKMQLAHLGNRLSAIEFRIYISPSRL